MSAFAYMLKRQLLLMCLVKRQLLLTWGHPLSPLTIQVVQCLGFPVVHVQQVAVLQNAMAVVVTVDLAHIKD